MLVGIVVAASSLTASYGVVEDPFPRGRRHRFPACPVQADLNGHQPVRCQPGHQFGSDQGAVGGDAGHDAVAMAGRQDLFEIGTDERLAAAKVDLKDSGSMELLHQVECLGGGEFTFGRVAGRRKTVTAAEVTRQGHFPGQIYRGAHPHFDVFIAHGEILFPGVG